VANSRNKSYRLARDASAVSVTSSHHFALQAVTGRLACLSVAAPSLVILNVTSVAE
jgi:hypothetical protein